MVSEGNIYIDDALDAGLLHCLAARRLVDILVVLPSTLKRTRGRIYRSALLVEMPPKD
jgi:hypothetical protein